MKLCFFCWNDVFLKNYSSLVSTLLCMHHFLRGHKVLSDYSDSASFCLDKNKMNPSEKWCSLFVYQFLDHFHTRDVCLIRFGVIRMQLLSQSNLWSSPLTQTPVNSLAQYTSLPNQRVMSFTSSPSFHFLSLAHMCVCVCLLLLQMFFLFLSRSLFGGD